jgi:Lrp/AsnC family transcriptional regulator, leucine-responsive regulatory protein
MANSARNTTGLDERDIRLIALLEANPRASLAELARGLAISPQSVSERLARLQSENVLGFAVTLAPEKLGLQISAYIRIQPATGELARVAEIVTTIPEIVECDRVTGEDCFVARVFAESMTGLERVIDRLIPYARTNTSIVQSSPVPRRLPRYC